MKHTKTQKAVKSLQKNKYFDKKGSFQTSYVLKDKSTQEIIEVAALNPMHACFLAGWNHKDVVVVSSRELK
jgi:hypothetical protein